MEIAESNITAAGAVTRHFQRETPRHAETRLPPGAGEAWGFTLIELVLIIFVLALMTAVALPKLFKTSDVTVENAAIKLVADVRYAQNRATTIQARSRLNFPSSTTYELYECSNYDDTPGACNCTGGWIAGDLQADLAADYPDVTLASLVGDCIEFDALGRPYYNAGCADALSCNSSAGSTVTLQSGGNIKNVIVETNTGMASF